MDQKNVLKKIYKIFQKSSGVKIDSREINGGEIFIGLKGEKKDGNNFAFSAIEQGAELVILDNPEVFNDLKERFPGKSVLVEDGEKFLQNLARLHRENLKIPILGITGSNGKTTTKELVSVVLSQKYNLVSTRGNLNNHLGVPLTILSIEPNNDFAVIEMGASHLGEIDYLAELARPNFGIITNIGKAHLGEFGSFENIVKTKSALYDFLYQNSGTIFINPKDELLMSLSLDFHPKRKMKYEVGRILNQESFLEVEIAGHKIKTNLMGDYNLNNLRAAYIVGKHFNIPENKIIESLENYIPQNSRSQFVKTSLMNEIILDCYNANPISMALSIKSFQKIKSEKDKVYILGDMKELGDFSQKEHLNILNELRREELVFLVGEEFQKLQERFKKFYFFKNIFVFEEFLKNNPLKNKNILLKGSNSINLIDIYKNNLI